MIMHSNTTDNIALDTSSVSSSETSTRRLSPKIKKLLPENFEPSSYSVIIGKGKMPANATGNRRLRVLVNMQIEKYQNAQFKRDKTLIVTNVMRTVQAACPDGGAFVKFDGERWWECPDSISREKIACMFRDGLSGIYRSSNKNKVERRRQKKALQRSKDKENEIFKLPETVESLNFPILEKEQHSFLVRQISSEQTPSMVPSTLFLDSIDTLDLFGMFETVDESIFDSIPL